jgi:uncharacterized OB-fold protein
MSEVGKEGVKYYCKNCGAQVKSSDTVCPKCGKNLSEVGRRIELTLVEFVRVSDSLETSLITNSIPEIEKALKEQDYFKATTFLAAILEYYGKQVIIGKLKNEGRSVDSDGIDRFHLSEVAIFLYGLKVIDQPCYSALKDLNKLRNSLLHIKDMDEFRMKSGKEAEATIRNAMECIGVLVRK